MVDLTDDRLVNPLSFSPTEIRESAIFSAPDYNALIIMYHTEN